MCLEAALAQLLELLVVDVDADVVEPELVLDRVGDVPEPAREVEVDAVLAEVGGQVRREQPQGVPELVVGLDRVVVLVLVVHNEYLCSA